MPSPSQFSNTLDDTTLDPDNDVVGVDDVGDVESKGITPTNLTKGAIANGADVAAAIIAAVRAGLVVRVVALSDGTLASDFENGDTVNGVVLATGDPILLAAQSTASENGIYVVAASGPPARAAAMPIGAGAAGALIVAMEGSVGSDSIYLCTNNRGADVVGTHSLAFSIYAPGATTVFSDAAFRVQDNGDATKQVALEASAITTGNTRTINMPDADVSLAGLVHDNVAGEIAAVTEKASPVGADLILIEDSAAGNAKKRVQITNLPGGADADAVHDNVAGEIAAVTLKATPVSGDLLLIEDSAASNAKKRVTVGSLPAGVDSTAIHKATAAEISAMTLKGTPTTADHLVIEDAAAANAKKRITVGSLPSATAAAKGFVELATQAEYDTGTDTGRVAPVSVSKKLTSGYIWFGNGSNIATEISGGGAGVSSAPPWRVSTTSDPDETDTGYGVGWMWFNSTNGKSWICVASGVWRCQNVVAENDASSTTRTVDNTYDGSIKRYSYAGALTINVPNSLNNGLTFEAVAEHAQTILTITMTSGTVRFPATLQAVSAEQFSSLVVTVLDTNECLVRGHMAAA